MKSANTNDNQKSAIAATIEGGLLTLSFVNGKKIEVNSRTLDPTIAMHATMHGLKQKLVDAAAISRNTDTGRAASVEDKYQAVLAVFERITDKDAPSWNAVREGGAGAGGGLLLRALVQMYAGKKTKDQLVEYLETKTAAEKTALRKNPKIAAIIDSMREVDETIDTDALLGELSD